MTVVDSSAWLFYFGGDKNALACAAETLKILKNYYCLALHTHILADISMELKMMHDLVKRCDDFH